MKEPNQKKLPGKHVIFTFRDLGIISVYRNLDKIFGPFMAGGDSPQEQFGQKCDFSSVWCVIVQKFTCAVVPQYSNLTEG